MNKIRRYLKKRLEKIEGAQGMIFSKQELRQFKRNQLDPDSVKVNKASCLACSNVISFTQVFTKEIKAVITLPAQDDEGYILGVCNNCSHQFSIHVTNPDYSSFSGGAELVGYILKEEATAEDALKLEAFPSLTQVLSRELDMNRRSHIYEYAGRSIYECEKCSAGLEENVLDALRGSFRTIFSEFSAYWNWSLKNGRGLPPEYMFIRMQFNCSCGSACIAYLSKPYVESYDFDERDFSICNIVGAKPLAMAISPGVYSKSQIMQWLHKLLARWTVLFDRIYIIVPFVGHQWMKDQELVDTWLELILRADPSKVSLVTRKGQLTSFKNAYQRSNGIDYSLLEKLDLASRLLREVVPDSKFHAKIYGAVSKSGCEVFSGSANLLSGPSKEVMHFTFLDSMKDFNDAFIKPLDIKLKKERVKPQERHSLIFDSANNFNTFGGASTVRSSEYRNLMLFDKRPQRDF
ncbi:hypothetical protein ABZQ70_09490 [Pseudomonas aeruginosa]